MNDNAQELLDIVRQLRAQLEYRKMLGVTMIESPRVAPRTTASAAQETTAAVPGTPATVSPSVPGTPAESSTLEAVRAELGECTRCKLANGRTHIVFGEGNPEAELVFVGEGPGSEEDQQGRPFVGAAGQLLTDIIVKGMKLRREDVYICNIVKCRPPGNRNPEPDEIEACEPFLKAQLSVLKPKVIVTLGKFAAQTLLRETTPITRLRGQWRTYQQIPLMPTFHPAYLLRTPADKKLAWMDLKEVMKRFGKEPA